QDPAHLVAGRLVRHRLAADAVPADFVTDSQGMRNAGAEADPRTTVFAPGDNFGDRAFDHISDVGGTLQLARDEFAAADVDSAHIDARICRLGTERGQIAVLNSFPDLVGEDDLLEQRAVTLMQVATVE